MENKSKKNSAIFMILGGMLVLANYLLKIEPGKSTTNNIIIMVCASVFILVGILSFKNSVKKHKSI